MAANGVMARSGASSSGGRRSLCTAGSSPAPAPALSAVSDSELSGPRLARVKLPDSEARRNASPSKVISLQQHVLQAGIDEYDRTVRTLMSRVLGRSGEIRASPGGEEVRRPEAACLEVGSNSSAPHSSVWS
mmetsp:Transcript_57066/g.179163  ORF Transcript_57066/g.179163 Transcript_57066/m.179163 type:complete len:132 (+) Transcript_57066:683-1078(+)